MDKGGASEDGVKLVLRRLLSIHFRDGGNGFVDRITHFRSQLMGMAVRGEGGGDVRGGRGGTTRRIRTNAIDSTIDAIATALITTAATTTPAATAAASATAAA